MPLEILENKESECFTLCAEDFYKEGILAGSKDSQTIMVYIKEKNTI